MAYSRYTWSKSSTPTPDVPLVADLDPEHLTPSDVQHQYGDPLWMSNVTAPVLPDELTREPYGTPVGGGGPIDHTPTDPDYGRGPAPALDTLGNQDLRGAAMSEDFGAVAARRYIARTDREPGSGPHVAIIPDTPGDGVSPSTPTLRYGTAVGDAWAPNARLGKRIKRWWDRYIDFHRYDPVPRPMYKHYATTVTQNQPPVPGGNQLTSPFHAFTSMNVPMDAFVAPQERRTPIPWDEPITTDGIPTITTSFGLPGWGL